MGVHFSYAQKNAFSRKRYKLHSCFAYRGTQRNSDVLEVVLENIWKCISRSFIVIFKNLVNII